MAYPTAFAASDVWSLRDVYKAEAGSNWPTLAGYDYTDPANIGAFVNGGFLAGVIDTISGTIDSSDDYQTGERYALIVGPKSLEADTDTNYLAWDSQDRSGEAGCFTRWNGLSSTENILAKNDTSYEVFEHIRSIRSSDPVPDDGGSDWYLPALDEIQLIYKNLKPEDSDNQTGSDTSTFPGEVAFGENISSDPQGSPNTASDPQQTNVVDFQEGGTEALGFGRYWTSTDGNESSSVWYLNVTRFNGSISTRSKTDSSILGVRPVRRVFF